MDELNLQALLLDESFINYCKRTNNADIEKWEKWLQKYPEHKESVAELKETIVTMGYHAGELAVQTNYARLQSQIKKRSNQYHFAAIGATVWFKVAAAIIAVTVISLFLFRQQTPKESTEIVQHVGAPGKDAALLTLKDGSVVSLADIKNGSVVALQGGVEIQKNKDGELVYRAIEQGDATNPASNTIATNRGNQYQVILPDGSKAFLNANSTLTYPLRFFKDARSVRMTGEIYFEIAKVESGTSGRQKRIPFYVETENQKIEVLGTHFNIKSFGDHIVTTLVEGKVKLSFADAALKEQLLAPNDQVVFDKSRKSVKKEQVDPFYSLAWKNGNFAFDNASIQTVMDEVARWYDVEISYQDQLQGQHFSGTISRYENIDKLLKTIAFAGGVHFERKGRRIYVLN